MTGSPLSMYRTGPSPEPVAEALGTHGRIVYPPPFMFPGLDSIPFRGALPPIVPTGSATSSRQLVLLNGPWVRAVFHFRFVYSPTPSRGFTLVTRPIRIATFHEKPPRVALNVSPAVAAAVSTRRVTRGELYHVGWFSCLGPSGQVVYGGSGFYEGFSSNGPPYFVGFAYRWVPTRGNILHPGCGHPLEWHVVAGWQGQPAAHITYVRGGRLRR
jgi:hypothetical protein